MGKTIKGWKDPDGNEYMFKDEIAREQNLNLSKKIVSEEADRKSEIDIERKRINNIVAGTVSTTKFMTVNSENVQIEIGPSDKNVSFDINTNSNKELLNILSKNPRIIEARLVEVNPDARLGVENMTYYQRSTINNDYIGVSLYATMRGPTCTVTYRMEAIFAYDDEVVDTSSAELADIRVGADGEKYDNAGEAVRQQISSLKEDLGLQKIPPAKLSVSKITDNIYSKYDEGWTQDKTDKWKIFNFYNVLANTKIYFGGILDQDFRDITNANMAIKIEEYNSSDEKVAEHSYPVLSSLWQATSFTSNSNTTKIKVILNANSASFDYTIEMLKKYNNKLYVGYTPISAIDMYYPKYLMYSQEELEKKFEKTNQKIKEIERHIFYVGSTRLYTKIKDAIAEAVKYMDSIVYVDSGTYDLISEFGDDYFSGITGDSISLGIILKNRVKVIFSSNSKVTCHYKGTNKNVCMYFQCFRPSTYGGSLVNLNLEASRIRYPIHDERIQNTDQYINEYINCDIEFDNTKNEYWTAKQCIGGGLGTNGQIIIKNCSFNTIFSKTPSSPYGVVSYHNTGASFGKSKIDVDGCYFGDKQTFRMSYYGTSKDVSVAKVHGCSLGGEPLKLSETASSTVDNVEIKSYCNDVRTS